MKRIKILNIFLVLAILASGLAAAQPVGATVTMINPSFEAGNLTGWTASSTLLVTVKGTVTDGAAAKVGSWCARLKSNSASVPTTLYQAISASAGDEISGWAYFIPGLPGTYDCAKANLIDSAGNLVGTAFNSANYTVTAANTGWVKWSYVFTSAFNGKLEFSVKNCSGSTQSVLAADGIVCVSMPAISAGGPYYVDEGKRVSLHGSSDNPSGTDTFTWDWTFTDFNGNTTSSQLTGKNVEFSAAAINGNQDVPIHLTVSDGVTTTSATTTVHVKNVEPIIAFNPQASNFIHLGEYYNNTQYIVDPGPGHVTVNVNYDDPGYVQDQNDSATQENIYEFPPITPGVSFNLAHKFSHQGLFNVLVTVQDSTGTTDSKVIQVKVDVDNNTAPYVTKPATSSYKAKIGETITINFASYDIDANIITVTPSGVPAGAVFSTAGQLNGYGTFTWNTTGATAGIYPMVIDFSDGALSTRANITMTVVGSDIDIVIVVNHPPVARAGGPYSTVLTGNNDVVTLDASQSSDPDAGDVLSYGWDFNNDGDFTDLVTQNPQVTVDAATLNQFGIDTVGRTYLFKLKVTDGQAFSIDFATLQLIAPTTYVISSSAGINGSIAPSPSITLVYGSSQTFSITPDPGYHVADVLVDDVSAGPLMSYTFTDVEANHSIKASFAANSFSVALSSSANPSYYGQPLTFTAAIKPSSSAVSVPDGTVQFVVDNVNLGPVVNLGVADSTGQRSAAINVTPPLNAGSHAVVAGYTLADGTVQTATLTQVVNKVSPVITWNNPEDIVYGTELSAVQLNAAADVDGALTYDPAAGTLLEAGDAQALNVNFVPDDTLNYNDAFAEVSINVLQASPLFSELSSPAITVGTATTSLSGSISLLPAGSIITITLNGVSQDAVVQANGAFSADFDTSALTVGAYDIDYSFAGNNNYTPVSATGSLTVTAKLNPVITWANPVDIVYGTALSDTQLNASAADPVTAASLTGIFTYSPAADTILNAGTNQALNVSFAPNDTLLYNSASKQVSLNVLPASPTFSNLSSPAITVGTANTTLGGSISLVPAGTVITITVNGISQTTVTDVNGAFSADFNTSALTNASGPYTITYSFEGNDNFNAVTGSGTLTVNAIVKLDPVITWVNPADIVYGAALSANQLNASLTDPSILGTFNYTTDSGTILNAGNNQALTVDFTPANTTNYNNATAAVYINVIKATPVITWANPADIVYGTALSAAQLNASVTDPGILGTLNYTPASGTILNAGNNQALTVDFTPADTTNYNSASKQVSINVLPAGPSYQATNFVIWGGNQPKLEDAVKVGQTFTFWGAKWEKQVTAGKYTKNASFKGWANSVSADGKTWTTAPGNSSNPPESIGKYISVLVSTNITKKGSVISGNVVAIVILEVTDPSSYAPNPGHQNMTTGKVVSFVTP